MTFLDYAKETIKEHNKDDNRKSIDENSRSTSRISMVGDIKDKNINYSKQDN